MHYGLAELAVTTGGRTKYCYHLFKHCNVDAKMPEEQDRLGKLDKSALKTIAVGSGRWKSSGTGLDRWSRPLNKRAKSWIWPWVKDRERIWGYWILLAWEQSYIVGNARKEIKLHFLTAPILSRDAVWTIVIDELASILKVNIRKFIYGDNPGGGVCRI